MGKIFRRLQFFLMLGGLVFLGLNFANPKLRQESMKSITAPLQQATKVLPEAIQPEAEEGPEIEERYVQIEGKLYLYNPKHIYTVNGVRMMYKNGNPKTREQLLKERGDLMQQVQQQADGVYGKGQAQVQPAQPAGQKIREMIQKNPLAVYTPGGAAAVVEGAREAAAAVESRNKALDQLTKE